MFYLISFTIISFIYLNFSWDWTSFNTCLILLLFISISELFKSLSNSLKILLDDVSLEKTLALRSKLEKRRVELLKWSDTLKDASAETAILQLKAIFVLLNSAVKSNDKEIFNLAIKKLQLMKIPEEHLKGSKKLEEFIKDVDAGKYTVEFDKDTFQPYFVIKNNK